MKIIDKTPLHDEKGQLGLSGRLQGTLKYGLSWSAELDAQKKIIAQFDRVLEKGFVLIRNLTLPNSEIIIPMILVGPMGIAVIYVTTVKGFFEAKGDQWNTVVNGRAQPARINLLNRVYRYARAVQIYLERQKFILPSPVEAVLITADPGAHIESMRPIARVVMSDAVKQFANSLLQARPVWRGDMAYNLAERIVDPRTPQEGMPAAAQPPDPQQALVSRAQAIFNASEESKSFDPKDLGFAFDEESQNPSQAVGAPQFPAQPMQPLKTKKIMGMTTRQVVILGVLFLCEICIVTGFLGYYLMNQ